MEEDESKYPYRKYDRTSAEQIKCYVKYCKEYPEMVTYQTQTKAKNTPKHVNELWKRLVNEINEMRGPTRDVKRWKFTFRGWRKALRYRARKLKAEGLSDDTLPAYSDLVLHEGKPITKPVKTENSQDTMDLCDENEEDSSNEAENNEEDSDVEYPFDSIFYPDHSSIMKSMESATPAKPKEHQREHSFVNKAQTENNEKCCCHKLMKSLEARDERLFTQQQNVINKLDQTLLLMTKVLEKLTDKLDTL